VPATSARNQCRNQVSGEDQDAKIVVAKTRRRGTPVPGRRRAAVVTLESALAASLIPALRASLISPLEALREE
jgi:hypothetical protein